MKVSTLTNVCLTLMLCFALSLPISAQQMFMIHEDVVRVDKMMQYEEAAATLHKYIVESGANLPHSTAMTNDLHYLYVMPLANHAAIDDFGKNWAPLNQKFGEEKMNALWKKFDECYDVHKNYLITLDEDLSYYPSGDIMADDGGNARKWTYIYAHPDKGEGLTAVAKKWKELYQKHGIERGYRVYRGGLGTDIGTLIIVDYGKDLADIAMQEKKNQEKIGAEGQALWMETTAVVRQYEEKYGEMRPDLSVEPGENR